MLRKAESEVKVLIVSDSHGRHLYLNRVIDKVSPIDGFIHLGDTEGYEDEIELLVDCPKEIVSGNNDYFSKSPKEKVIELGGYRIFITHGHRYHVSYGVEEVKQRAREEGASIVMFGHTHIPFIDTTSDITVINPGSISLPRQDGRKPTYIIMEIDSYGKVHFTLNYIS